MSDMIEQICKLRAAKHYAKRFGKPETDEHVVLNVTSNWIDFEAEVRETIEAMREPTDAMSDVGYAIETERYRVHAPQEDKCAVECWQAMIDAALKCQIRA